MKINFSIFCLSIIYLLSLSETANSQDFTAKILLEKEQYNYAEMVYFHIEFENRTGSEVFFPLIGNPIDGPMSRTHLIDQNGNELDSGPKAIGNINRAHRLFIENNNKIIYPQLGHLAFSLFPFYNRNGFAHLDPGKYELYLDFKGFLPTGKKFIFRSNSVYFSVLNYNNKFKNAEKVILDGIRNYYHHKINVDNCFSVLDSEYIKTDDPFLRSLLLIYKVSILEDNGLTLGERHRYIERIFSLRPQTWNNYNNAIQLMVNAGEGRGETKISDYLIQMDSDNFLLDSLKREKMNNKSDKGYYIRWFKPKEVDKK